MPKQHEPVESQTHSKWLLGWLVAMAAELPGLAAGAAAGLAASCFLDLWRRNTARERLQCGLVMPLLLLTGDVAVPLVVWLIVAAATASIRERGWLARAASMLTALYPAMLLLASRAYLSWLGAAIPLR